MIYKNFFIKAIFFNEKFWYRKYDFKLVVWEVWPATPDPDDFNIVNRGNKASEYSGRSPSSSRRLAVTFRVEDFLPAHCADSFLVSASLAIMGTALMNFSPANSTFQETFHHGVEPVLFRRQQLVLVDFTATSFGSVSCSIFPLVWSNDLKYKNRIISKV